MKTVADIIEHLKTLPPDMEVWTTWDESGEYFPADKPLGRIDTIVQGVNFRGHIRWEYDYGDYEKDAKRKTVCVLEAETIKIGGI